MNGRWVAERLLATTSLAALMLATMSGEADAQACATVGAGGSYNSGGTVPCVTVTGAGVSVTNQLGGSIGGSPVAPTLGAILVQAPGGSLSGGINNSGTVTGHTGAGVSVGIGIEGNVAGGITNSGTVTAHDHAIQMFPSATFGGGISNSGTLQATNTAVFIAADTFAGGIANSGTGTIFGGGASGAAVLITSELFSGGISNAGSITMNVGLTDFALGIDIDGSGDATFIGGITNAGTIHAYKTGILVQGLTSFSGGIVNTAGHSIASNSCNGVMVRGVANFAGGITNAGTLLSGASSTANGITVGTAGVAGFVSTFAGGIINSGNIGGQVNGIAVSNVRTFAGGITNSGLITGSASAIHLVNVLGFSGGIVNSASGTIGGGNCGIAIYGVSAFANGITNAGTITAGFTGIVITNGSSTFSGGITNSGSITGSRGISVSNATFLGGITNSGTINGTLGTAIDLTTALTAVNIAEAGGTILGQILFSSHGDTLTGYGTVVGNMIQGNATIAPTLAGTGILRIAGNLTQGATSKTVIEVSPAAAALLQVTGTASIAGGLTVVFDPGTYTNKVYTLVHSGTLNGTYAGATMSGSVPGGTQTISYTPSDVDLTLDVPAPVVPIPPWWWCRRRPAFSATRRISPSRAPSAPTTWSSTISTSSNSARAPIK